MKRTMSFLPVLVLALAGVAPAQRSYVLLSEDFEGLVLGPKVDEGQPGEAVWTKTPPAGWTIDDTGVPGVGTAQDGVTEWAGWSFANREWWTTAAGDQNRSQFTKGVGAVAIADPDEWDDAPRAAGRYNTYLSTPSIDISNARPGTVELTFDSSWRPEFADYGEQSGNLKVSFDDGPAQELFLWLSDTGSPNFKQDATNETVTIQIDNPAGAKSMVLTFGLFNCGNNWWWAIDNVLVTALWSGIRASHPRPADGTQEVSIKSVLSWTPGEFVSGLPQHRVLLSRDPDAVQNAAAVVATQDPNRWDATGSLDFGTTYYWRVDEANSVRGWDEGSVWSFTTEPYGYPVQPVAATASSAQTDMGPEKTIDGSGLDQSGRHGVEPTTMWLSAGVQPNWIQYQFNRVYKFADLKVWNSNQLIESFLGFGARSVKLDYSVDGTAWTALADVPEFAQAPGLATYAANTTVNLGGILAQFIRLTVNTTWGGLAPQAGLSEVAFTYIPVQARAPQPAEAAADVSVDTSLAWYAGREAASHQVYFGTDRADVAAGTASAQTTTEPDFNPGPLNFSTTYYWRVDEVNAVTYPGDLWSFTTAAFKVVDDFESYTSQPGEEVFSTWADGFDNPAQNGAIVGLATAVNRTFCDTTIFHGGKASMPFAYDNTQAPLSETTRTFAAAQDWTTSGIKSLSLWFRGTAGNSGQLYAKINGTKMPYHGEAASLGSDTWQVWNIDLAQVGQVNSVRTLALGVEGNGAQGTLHLDDIHLNP
jgi:hypothetical protein